MVVVGGIYSPNHYSSRCCRWAHRTVRWCTRHCTTHCLVCATSADRWGLERLTVEVLCPLMASDSPVVHRTVGVFSFCIFDFCVVQCSLFTAVDRWTQLTVAPLAHRAVLCTLDSPVNYSEATPRKT
jgi:hypothetical protein